MMYYSVITQSPVSEADALKQIIDLCGRWYDMASPPETLDKYLQYHPQLLDIDSWNCFNRIN